MSPTSVYLGGLPHTIGRQELFSHLSIYGKINALNLQRGYAFVEFDSEADAMDLIHIFSNQPFMGHDVKIQHARQPRRNSVVSSRTSPSPPLERSHPRLAPEHARIRYPVLVNNLNTHTCWQELKDFGRLAGGTVAFCDIDKTNRRRGFLEYFTPEDADRAVRELSGKELLGNIVTLSGYGKKTLKTDTERRSRSRSPRRRHRKQSTTRSRSPLPMRRHNQGEAHPYAYPEYNAYTGYEHHPRGNDYDYDSRHAMRHVHFHRNEKTDADRVQSKQQSISRAVEFNDPYSDDLLMSDERRAKLDQIALGWEALQSSYPSLRKP